MNGSEVRSRIDKEGIKFCRVAERLGISTQALYNKINGTSEFSNSELLTLKEMLHLSNDEFLVLFFSPKGCQNANQKGAKNAKR